MLCWLGLQLSGNPFVLLFTQVPGLDPHTGEADWGDAVELLPLKSARAPIAINLLRNETKSYTVRASPFARFKIMQLVSMMGAKSCVWICYCCLPRVKALPTLKTTEAFSRALRSLFSR